MQLFFFVFIFAMVLGMAIVGLWKGNPWLTSFACIFAIGLSGMIFTEGIETPKTVSTEIIDLNASATIVVPHYETVTQTDGLVGGIAWILLAGSFVFLLFTVYYSFKGRFFSGWA